MSAFRVHENNVHKQLEAHKEGGSDALWVEDVSKCSFGSIMIRSGV